MKFKFMVIVICVLLMCGCSSITKIEKVKSVTVLDFTKYSDLGFLITTEPYIGKYQSIGILNCMVRSGARKRKIELENSEKMMWFVENLDTEEIMDLAYQKATELGGDAIMNFKIVPNDASHVVSSNGEICTVPGLSIYGFIIKRHD